MDLQSGKCSGHSAEVKISLAVNGHRLPVAQLGPDFILLDKPIDFPPSDGRIVLRVDDSERSWDVRLPEGISARHGRVAIAGAD
jgi:hypothetical protein